MSLIIYLAVTSIGYPVWPLSHRCIVLLLQYVKLNNIVRTCNFTFVASASPTSVKFLLSLKIFSS